eukprot:SAG11_NODE_1532_length_4732_cov_4.721563_4_plen_72_part_00
MWMADSEAERGEGAALMCDLFPHSLLGAPEAVVRAVSRRFELLGWLFGKVLIDKSLDDRCTPRLSLPVISA